MNGAMNSDTDRTVLITGCSSGIGYCVALGLRDRGYRVFATARDSADVSVLTNKGFEALRVDLNDSDSIDSAVESVFERTGGELFGLFNNAGFGQPGAVEDLSRKALREQFETNVFGTHELTCRVVPAMRRQGRGRIIQNSSVLGFVSLRYRGAYNSSKHALEALTDTLRMELEGTGIRVSLIQPGPIESRFRQNAYAAYQRNIDPRKSAHHDTYMTLERRLQSEDSTAAFTLPPEAVLKKVIHALESSRPRTHYYVTFPTYLFAALKRLLPRRSLDRVLLGLSRRESR